MATPGPAPEVTLEDTYQLFDDVCEPLSAPEIAEELGCGRRTAHRKLEQLVERGDLNTKKVGARSRIWWRPSKEEAGPPDSPGEPTKEFWDFVQAVEDYAIFTMDPEGHVASWNQGVKRIKGYDADEIIGEHFSTFYTAEDTAAGVPEANLEAAKDQGMARDEGWRVRKDGTKFWADVVITAIRDDDGTLQGFTKVTQDLTERKRAEAERELQYTVTKTIAEAESVESGLDRVIEDVCEISEWRYGEVWIPDGDRITLHSNVHSGAVGPFAEASRAASFGPGEGLVGRIWETGDSEWVTVDEGNFERADIALQNGLTSFIGVPVSPLGTLEAILVFGTDDLTRTDDQHRRILESVATELEGLIQRKRAEESLAREREFLDKILEASPVGIASITPEGEISLANSRAKEVLGLSRGVDLGYPFEERAIRDEDGNPVPPEKQPFARVVETGDPVYEWSGQLDPEDGDRRWISVNAAPIHGDDGGIEQIVVTGEDITALKERQRELQRERDFTDQLLETVPMGMFLVDRDGRIDRMNDRARSRFELEDADEFHFGDLEVYDEEGDPLSDDSRPFARVIATGDPVRDWEGQFALPTGRVWMSVSAVPLPGNGDPDHVVVAMNDITKLKNQARFLERRKAELEAELSDVFQRVTDAFYALDENWRFTHINDRAAALTRRSKGELLGESIWEAFPELADDTVWDRYHEAMATQESVSFEYYFEESEFWAEMTVYPSETGLSVYFRDITDRVQRKHELERYETIIETMVDGVYVIDPEGRFELVNQAYAEMTGYAREELVGATASLVVDDSTVERAREVEAELLSGESETTTIEADILRADGTTVPAEATFSILRLDRSETDYRRVGVVRDITERKRYEERMRSLNEIAQSFLRSESETEVSQTIVKAAREILDLPNVAVYLHESETDSLVPTITSSEGDYLTEAPLDVTLNGTNLIEQVFSSQEAYRFDDLREIVSISQSPGSPELRSGEIIPLGDHGVLVFGAREAGGFDEDIQRLVEILAANAEAAYDRVAHKRELMESERKYRTLAQNFPNGVVALFDEELRFELAEGRIFDHLDITAADIEGRTVEELSDFGLGPERVAEFESVFAGQRSEFEATVPGFVFDFLTVPVTDTNGNVRFGLATAQDVTEREERERELERQRNKLSTLNSLNDLVHDVSHLVIESNTREEVERQVCERLAASEAYEFAWIGELDPIQEEVRLRTEAGVEGYLEDFTIPVDGSESGGPTAAAIRGGEVQVARKVHEHEDDEVWRRRADEYDYRSSAAIPIVYDWTPYGVLNVYTDREKAFDDDEREVISRLGEVIGHAINALERKEALVSEDIIELRFQVRDLLANFGIDSGDGGTIRFERAVPVSEGVFLQFGTVTPDMVEALRAMVDALPHFEDVRFLDEGEGVRRFELRLNEPPAISTIASYGGRVDEAAIEAGDFNIVVHVPHSADVNRVVNVISEEYPGAEVIAQRHTTRPADTAEWMGSSLLDQLTEKQRAALETAFFAGFFEWPRDTSGEDIAESMGISPPTFHQHVRLAERKLLDTLLDAERPRR